MRAGSSSIFSATAVALVFAACAPAMADTAPAGEARPAVLAVRDGSPDAATALVPERAAASSPAGDPRGADLGKDLDPEPPVQVPAGDGAKGAADQAPPASDAVAPMVPAPTAALLPPLDAAIRRAVERREAMLFHGAGAAERRAQRDALALFYAAHDFAPLWSVEGKPTPAVDPIVARLAHAGDDALTLTLPPASLAVKGTPDAMAESELALSEAVIAYARQASGSRVDPRTIAPLIGLKPPLADAAEALETVAAAGSDAGDRLRDFNPSEPRYKALREKLAQMRATHTPATASRIPAGPDLKVGMSDPRVPLVRSRFSLDGTPDGVPQDLRYDTQLAAAVAGFQKANGLPASGILTRRTVAALSGGQPSRLEGELVANMEMWRWMPRDLGADRIEVNVPDYAVTVFRADAAVDTHRVVVGKKDTPTPIFSNAMRFVVVNPVWNVPESIIRKEMLPKLATDPGYLDRLGYTVVERGGRLIVRQPPGEKNALGRIKFLFPNDYAVYLHDTPSKALFASRARAFSHGCVRVDQPFRFGESVLGADRDKGWNEKRLKGLLGEKERTLTLPRAMPIHIEYFTASVDGSGRLDLRDDVYDYTRRIAAALGQAG